MLNIKLFKQLIVIVVVCYSASVVSASQVLMATMAGKDKIEDIAKNKSTLVIGDQLYKLKLNTKVVNSKGRVLNRYALKIGQRIQFKFSIENRQRFIDAITIFSE